MKIDRQIAILSILLQKEKITADELARRLEVSSRTIYRDIEDLSRAGIPVAAYSGRRGGIYIMPGYKLDKTLLSSDEAQAILTGLKSLDSVSESGVYKRLMDKLSIDSDSNTIIDLSGWSKDAVSGKLELLKQAIDSGETVNFSYLSPNGHTEREIEPYRLIFQWSSWYVWGFCLLREDYRMFKLKRMNKMLRTGRKRAEREVTEYVPDKLLHTEDEIKAVVKFDRSQMWRIADEQSCDLSAYADECADGSILREFTWSDLPSFYSYILSFGDKAEIVSPEEYRSGFAELLKNISKRYWKDQ